MQHVTADWCLPAQFKTAVITPRLKKPGMDINTAQELQADL